MLRLPARMLIIACLAGVVACDLPSEEGSAEDDHRRVRFAFAPDSLSTLYLFVAEEQGLFETANIHAEYLELASGNDQLNALLAGRVDVLPAVSIVPVLHLELQRPGTVRVFSHSVVTSSESFDKVIVRSDSSMESLAALAGGRVGVALGTTATSLFRAALNARGIDAGGVEFIQLPLRTQLGSLRTGLVDAVLSYEPLTTAAILSGEFRVLHGSINATVMEGAPTGVSVLARRFERSGPELARRVISILDQGISAVRQDPLSARKLLPRITEMPRHVAREVHINPLIRSDELDVETLREFIDILYSVGEIPSVVAAEQLLESSLGTP